MKVRLKLVRAYCHPNNTEERDAEAEKRSALLLREIDATNKWARLGAQLYFGWVGLILIVNGLATGWLFTYRGARPPLARLLFLVLIGLNLMGTIVTFYIHKYMHDADRRIHEVLEGLTRHHVPEGRHSEPQSPVPRQVINLVFAFTGATLFTLLLFWTALEIWLNVLLA